MTVIVASLALMLTVWGAGLLMHDAWRRYLVHRASEREAVEWSKMSALAEDHEQRIADLERSRREDSLARMGRR